MSIDGVLSNPQILGVPLLLVANKQDSPQSLSVDEIRHDYEDWHQRKLESARRSTYGESDNNSDRRERIASLEVMGVSALEGYVILIGLPLILNGGSTFNLHVVSCGIQFTGLENELTSILSNSHPGQA